MNNRTGPLTEAHGNDITFLSLQDVASDYTSIAASINAQDAKEFLPEYYTSSNEVLNGFTAQRSVLAKRLLSPDAAVLEFPFGVGRAAVAIEKPLSRGTVTINGTSTDPADAPIIDFGALRNPVDVRIAVEGIKMARKWFAAPSLAVRRPVGVVPGSNVTTDSQIADFIRTSASASLAHPCGTAQMAPKKHGGVVGPDLKVYGVRGLRVVDASIIPLIPACHLQATVYAVAEKAADIIKGGDA